MSVFGIKSTSHRDWKVRGTIQSPSLKVQTGCVRPEGNITEVHEMVNSTGRKLFNIQTATTHVGTVRTVTEATVEAAEMVFQAGFRWRCMYCVDRRKYCPVD